MKAKFVKISTLVAACLFFVSANAQQTDTKALPSAAERAKHQTERLDKLVTLTPEQKAKIEQVNLEMAQQGDLQMKKERGEKGKMMKKECSEKEKTMKKECAEKEKMTKKECDEKGEMMKKMKDRKATLDAKYKEILTPEQYTKYQEQEKKVKAGMKDGIQKRRDMREVQQKDVQKQQ